MNPILIFKTIGVSVGLGGGITGSIFSSFQAFTRVTIEDLLKDDLFSGEENDWKILKEKLDESKNTDDKKLKLTKLEGIKENSDGSQNWSKLKTWCSTKKSFKIKKLLPSSFESLLLSYIKDFCILTIGEKLTLQNQFTDWTEKDKTKLKANAKNLGSHQEGTNGKITGIKELEEIKKKNSNSDENGQDLLKWCKSTYKKSYKNKEDNLWKLSEKYCKKSNPGT